MAGCVPHHRDERAGSPALEVDHQWHLLGALMSCGQFSGIHTVPFLEAGMEELGASQDRCWTAERLARRGLQHHPRCLLCNQAVETIQHLLLTCPFARQTWHIVLDWLIIPVQIPDQEHTVTEWWLGAKELAPPAHRKALKSIALLVPWMLWTHRNACVFDNATPSIESLVVRIKDEARCWAEAGAQGLRVVLPTTWDVH